VGIGVRVVVRRLGSTCGVSKPGSASLGHVGSPRRAPAAPNPAYASNMSIVVAAKILVPPSGTSHLALNWGDVPTWVAAIGTVGALSTALFQIRTERQYRLKAEAADRAERHQAQARLISAFVGPVEVTPERDDLTRSWIYLINGSEEPVYRLLVGIVFMQGTAPQTTERWLGEILKNHPERQRPFTTLSILPPGRVAGE
jgi:hypothetical protein